MRSGDLFFRIERILGRWHEIPDIKGYRGTGGPGKLLERLLGVGDGNQDIPDAGGWEVKFTRGTSYLTLFHKEPMPRRPSIVNIMVMNHGWEDRMGRTSFRHTIWKRSKRGFEVRVENERITVVHRNQHVAPYWEVNDLTNAAATKLRRLVLVSGTVDKVRRRVRYSEASCYSGFRFSDFLSGLKEGWICVEFDARTEGNGIRNHGTKFRTRFQHVGLMYRSVRRITK
ncbi:MAG: MvaI/BcnI family restriction endonuclease [Nitrosopumilus sp.]|nr:MvaI/BcnI family restriction endonuclease [Nitrosopumilus sp.]